MHSAGEHENFGSVSFLADELKDFDIKDISSPSKEPFNLSVLVDFF